MNIVRIILGIFITATLFSCGGDKKKPIYVDLDEISEESDSTEVPSGNKVVVPFCAEKPHCKTGTYNRQKYKPYILKYKALILK